MLLARLLLLIPFLISLYSQCPDVHPHVRVQWDSRHEGAIQILKLTT